MMLETCLSVVTMREGRVNCWLKPDWDISHTGDWIGLCNSQVQWVDPSWMPDDHQSPPITDLPSWAGERKNNKFTGWDKGRERSLTSHCHGQNRHNWGKLINHQSNQSRVVRSENQILKRPLPHACLLPGFNFTPEFSPFSAGRL